MVDEKNLPPEPGEMLFDVSAGYTCIGVLEKPDSIKQAIEVGTFGEWRTYRMTYKTAADNLARILLENPMPTIGVRTLIYPIFYLYRHAVELYLKELIFMAEDYKEWPVTLNHDLKKAMTRLTNGLKKHGTLKVAGDQVAVNSLKRVVEEIATLSNTGEEVRYGFDKKGNLTNHHLNILNPIILVVTISKAFNTMDAIWSGLDAGHQDRD